MVFCTSIKLDSLTRNSTVELTAGDLSDILAELGIQEMLDALLVSIGEDGGQLIQSLSVWISNFMANLQSLLANMDPDSLVELTGKIPDFIIEASDDTARDLCREEEGDVESEDADDDDSVAMSPCSLAQMFASKVKGGGSKEEYSPVTPAPIFRSATSVSAMARAVNYFTGNLF